MISIVLFLFASFVSILDPIALAGYFVAGIFIRMYWVSAAVGVLYRLFLYYFFVLPVLRFEQADISLYDVFPSLFGAFLVTSLIFFVARKIRTKKLNSPE